MVSIYLNYGDPKKQPEGWHVCAQFALAISNPHDGTCYIQSRKHVSHPNAASLVACRFSNMFRRHYSEAQHRFTNDEQDWGFTRFVELRKLFSPADSRVKPIIENDETIITAYVRVLKDETGVLWHNFVKFVPPFHLLSFFFFLFILADRCHLYTHPPRLTFRECKQL